MRHRPTSVDAARQHADDLFRSRLDMQIDLRHAPAQLARTPWTELESALACTLPTAPIAGASEGRVAPLFPAKLWRTSMEVRTTNEPIQVIRRARDMHFPVPSRVTETMMSQLRYQALILGSDEVSLARLNEWRIISSKLDWIAARKHAASEVFFSIIPCPEDGPNSHRYEIVVAAFSSAFISIGEGGQAISQGDCKEIQGELEKCRSHVPNGRVLAFRVDP